MLPTLQQANTDSCLPQRLPDTHRQVSCGVTVHFSLVLVNKILLYPLSLFPSLCKFWLLYSGVNGDLLQEDLCHSHTQSPRPCGGPQLTCTSTGDAQIQFCLSLGGMSGSWWAQGLFGPSESLWQECGLILNANSPLLSSCWGFSFALRCGESPHSCSSAYCITGVSLTLDVGYLFMAAPATRCFKIANFKTYLFLSNRKLKIMPIIFLDYVNLKDIWHFDYIFKNFCES